MKTGFFESISGNNSSSRLIGFLVIVYAMLMGFLVLYWGTDGDEGMIALATASGVLFTTIAGPVFVWLYNQKKTEIKQETNE